MKITRHTIRIFAITTFFTANALATVSADRLNQYKNMGIIDAGKIERHIDVELFYNTDSKQWTKGGLVADLMNKYGDMTLDEWLAFDWTSDDAQEAAGYLSGVINNEIKSGLPQDDAKDALLNGFTKDFNGFFPIRGIEKECEALSNYRTYEDPNTKWSDIKDKGEPEGHFGMLYALQSPKIDFHKANPSYDIWNFTADNHINLTPDQIMKLSSYDCEFAGLTLSEDFLLKAKLNNCDISQCEFGSEKAKKIALYFQTLAASKNNTYPSLEGVSISSAAEFMEIYKNPECSAIFSTQRPTVPREWVSFNGTEDFTGAKLNNAKIGNWTGVTAEQILSANPNFSSATLPAVEFNGAEDISKFNLRNASIANITGLTAAQIATIPAENLDTVWLTTSQYNAFKDVLKEKNIKRVVIDGKYTTP